MPPLPPFIHTSTLPSIQIRDGQTFGCLIQLRFMKRILLLLLACSPFLSSALAQDGRAQALRLVKGKVIDLTAALAAGDSGVYSNYWLDATITAIYPKCMVVRKAVGE